MRPLLRVQTLNTILYVRRWAATVAFYRTTLSLGVTHETDWFVEFAVCGTARLSIADASRATIAPSGPGRGVTITLEVADADQAWHCLRSRGVEVGAPRDHAWGARVFYLRDPEGHRLEVWSKSGSDSARPSR